MSEPSHHLSTYTQKLEAAAPSFVDDEPDEDYRELCTFMAEQFTPRLKQAGSQASITVKVPPVERRKRNECAN